MPIQNTAHVNDPHANDMRSALEHRATWFYLLLEEMEKAGVDWEALGRKAVTRCGLIHGATKFTKTDDLKKFAKEFENPLYAKIFEMDVQEQSAEKFQVEFHYCPLVAAWQKLTKDERKIEKLCDIAMDGDRGILAAFPCFQFNLGDTIAKGGRGCQITITKKAGC
jgi:hypothetical protein